MFNYPGPYNFSPGVGLSRSLTYTPLILAPRGADTQIFYWNKSPYNNYMGLTSFKVSERVVSYNTTLSAIDENGIGGTKLSSSAPYSVMQISIFYALKDAFVNVSVGYSLTEVKPVAPFGLCYAADKIQSTRLGPAGPTIDLVLNKSHVVRRIYGSNLLVNISNNGVDTFCSGFVDDDLNTRTFIVTGGYQMKDNFLRFELERDRLGFSSSLFFDHLPFSRFWEKIGFNAF